MELGVMQGRMTEKGGFYPQIFPWLEWEDEFDRAQELELAHIEWMLNADRLPDNPIWSETGRKRICELEEQTGVQVRSLCLNFVMQYSLRKEEVIGTIIRLLSITDELKHLRNVIIPLEGASSQENCPDDVLLKKIILLGERFGNVHFLLESGSTADKQLAFMRKCNHLAGICYDVGNASGMGRNVLEELDILIDYLGEIHLKDKMADQVGNASSGGQISTYLGEGIVDFQGLSRWLQQTGYHGNLVLESYFDNAIADLRRNLSYLRSL